MIPPGEAVGFARHELPCSATAASMVFARSGRETALSARMNRKEFDRLGTPEAAAVYRRIGRYAWRQYRELLEQAKARPLRTVLNASAQPTILH